MAGETTSLAGTIVGRHYGILEDNVSRSRKVVEATKHLVAANRCLFGADDSTRGFGGPLGIETQLGKKMGIRNRHYSWNSNTNAIAHTWAADASAGCVPMISLGGQGYDETLVQEIGAGKHDTYWIDLFSGLSAPGLFRPWMEMNGEHNSYQASAPNYVKMWVRVHSLYVAYGHANLSWIFCPQIQNPLSTPWKSYYPGDALVDWIGYDLYRHFFSACQPWLDFANSHHKPFAICESGFQQGVAVHDAATGRKGDKDGKSTGLSLIEQTRHDVQANPNCVAYIVWNNVGPMGDDFIDTSTTSLAKYREFVNDPYFAWGR